MTNASNLTAIPSRGTLAPKLSQQEVSLLAKAEKSLGGTLVEVTKYSSLYAAEDMRRVIAVIDMDSRPSSRDEATSLAAALISKCRANALAGGPIGESDFKLYAVGLAEAFQKFPPSIGLQAIDGGSGVPSKSAFWPKPFDIVTFCEAIVDKRRCARVMAARHLAERERRGNESRRVEPSPEQKARVQRMVDNFKAGISMERV